MVQKDTNASFNEDVAILLDRTTEMKSPVEHKEGPNQQGFFRFFFNSPGAPQILILAVLLSLGIGCIIGILPSVVSDRYARLHYGYSGAHCATFERDTMPDACQSGSDDALRAASISAFVQNFLMLLTGSVIGSASDVYGRRAFLIVSMAISIPSPTALVLLQVIPTMSPTWFFVLDAGVGLVNWLSMSFAALSDVMPQRWRTASFGLVFAAFMIGLGIAPSLPLFFSHLAVSILAVSVLFLGFIFAVFFLPETLPSDIARESLERRDLTYMEEEDNESRTLLAQILCRPFHEMSILMRNRLILTISVGLFVSAVMYSSENTLLIYYIEDELNFRDHDIATMLFMNGICGIVIQAFALKFLVDYFGDKNLLMGTFICGTIHNLCFGLAKSKGMIYLALALSQLTKINFSLLTSMGSNTVGVTEQGTMQGALSSLSALANALGPVSLNLIYEHTKDCAYPGPGSMFIFASFLYGVGTVAMSTMPSKCAPIVSSSPLISSSENPHLEPLLQTARLSQDNLTLT